MKIQYLKKPSTDSLYYRLPYVRFFEKHKERTPGKKLLEILQRRIILIRCTGCGNEKIARVGKNWNPKASMGLISVCDGECSTGPSGIFHEFVKFVKAHPPQKIPEQ